uniref:Fibroblast growth factor 5 n=1 Tax=Hucho hucho TaxID=62062 RepID=A0A4W5JN78_9TELE
RHGWGTAQERLLELDAMNVPLSRFTFALLQLICAAVVAVSTAVVTGSLGYVSLEDQLLEAGTVSGSGRRTCRLYCRVGIGFHLQIHSDGRVNGSHEPNRLSKLLNHLLYYNRPLSLKFRERFQENSYNTYASLMHRNHRTGRDWYVALNKRGKAKMGSSPRVKSQHVATHFLPRLNLHDLQSEQGFTITDGSRERRKSLPVAVATKPPLQPKINLNTGTGKRVQTVKYWPKFRFG